MSYILGLISKSQKAAEFRPILKFATETLNAARLSDEKMWQQRPGMIPYRRLGQAEDVAGLPVFLASDEAATALGASTQ